MPGLSPVCGKPIIARFDGGQLSSDGDVLALREIETRLSIANRLAACVADPRAQERVIHSVADILRFRMLMIAAGYEDANHADSLRHDPAFKLALGRLPDAAALCSQPTISRLENLPRPRDLLRMGLAMVGLYCASFRQVPRRITLDIDDTFDAVQLVAPDAAHRRLLADVVAAPADASAIVLACGAVRYAAIAAAQNRHPRGGMEN